MDRSAALNRTTSENNNHRKLREACDSCHNSKVRCSGRNPCVKCRDGNLECQYSYMARLGKPKGSRNKKTLEKLGAAASKTAVLDGRTDGQDSYTALNHDGQLFSHAEPFGNLPKSEALVLPGQLDSDLFGIYLLSQPMKDDLWALSDAPNHQPNVTAAVGTNETRASAEEDSIRDDSISEWQQFLPSNTMSGDPPFTPTERCMVNTFHAAAASERSPLSISEGEDKMACACLKRLTDHLCHLNVIERNQNIICLDTMLSETDATLNRAEIVLECHFCLLESKVMLLIMTLLQTVLNWVVVEYKQKTHERELPPIYFGDWKISTADGHLIKVLLTSRILATSDSVVSTLRLRIHEITLKAGKQNVSYGFMDSEYLQQTLQRLTVSLRELTECIKS